MKLPWLKLWNEFAVDIKVQSMSEAMQRRLVMIFCLTSSGDIPGLTEQEIAHALSITKSELAKTKQLFIDKHFIDDAWKLSKWEKRQLPADPTAAERMRRLREKNRNVTVDVTVPLQDSYSNVTRNTRASVVCSLSSSSELEGGAGGNPPPAAPLGPEFTAVGELAIRLTKDINMGSWVSNMGQIGHSASAIRYAIQEGALHRKFDTRWLGGILKRVAIEGVPEAPNGHAEIKPVDTRTEVEIEAERAEKKAKSDADLVELQKLVALKSEKWRIEREARAKEATAAGHDPSQGPKP